MSKFYNFWNWLLLFLSISTFTVSCTTSGPAGLFGKKSPHEQYEDKIKTAGLQETALGRMWLNAAEKSLISPVSITIPYSETGYFPADQPKAIGLLFAGKRGEKVTISLSKNPATNFRIYLDLWAAVTATNTTPRFLLSADTTGATTTFDVDKDGSYILRLQPELLKGGEYTLSISTGPSLAFPVAPKVKTNIGSFWGAGRDAGARKHEGIDIFAPRGTPAVAAADGVIDRVTENTLGGKVVFLRPNNKDYTLYYAHLDKQLVQAGQEVKTGDTIGLVGNTGNARTTVTHLHFGIYTFSGAVDPLPFVNRVNKTPERISAPVNNLNNWVRNNRSTGLFPGPAKGTQQILTLETNTLLKAEAATAGWYRVSLPDGQEGFVASTNVSSATSPVKNISLKNEQPLLDEPSFTAAKKTMLRAGEQISILAGYKDFYYIKDNKTEEGWLAKKAL